ncbi:MAG TPA: hypothetical protein DDW84_05805 [Phycisphaerales bacterium]|nr:MAG: hypothetical protein A2Y13_10660 [Planctomycetes bacterium GWC2_45_44]HBG78348.1 hypothetical protein [Phycisphaerales bacterium]HBR19920.1 hypothetical protein [Phycisphaerales bacterium]
MKYSEIYLLGVILGWILWGIITLFAILITWSCRAYTKSEEGFKYKLQWTSVVQAIFFLMVAILFLIFKWNKLHILWIIPVIFLSTHFFVSHNIPILSPLVIYVTKVYLSIVLIGRDLKGGFDELLYDGSFKRGQLSLERRLEIIRILAQKRIQLDSVLTNEEKASSITDLTSNNILLMKQPEAAIVNIVASYLEYKLLGLSDEKNLTTIEKTRHFFKKGIMPFKLTLANYIKYSIELECTYEQAKSITDDFIEDATKETISFFLIEKKTELS